MITVKIKNIQKVTKNMTKRASRAQNLNNPMKVIAQKGEREVIKHFKEQSGPTGKWPMPKPATLRARNSRTNRSKKRKSSSILRNIDTGFLRGHIRSKATGNEAHIYSNEKYAATQNYGDPARNISAAPFMWIREKERQSMIGTLIKYILG